MGLFTSVFICPRSCQLLSRAARVFVCDRPRPLPRDSFGVHGAQDFEGAAQTCVNAHHPTGIVELAAVVRRREYGYKSTGCLELVPVLDHLMRSADDVQVMLFQEVTDDLVPERITYSPRVVACKEIKVQAASNQMKTHPINPTPYLRTPLPSRSPARLPQSRYDTILGT